MEKSIKDTIDSLQAILDVKNMESLLLKSGVPANTIKEILNNDIIKSLNEVLNKLNK